MQVAVGDKFVATTIDQTIEILDIYDEKKRNGKIRKVLKVEIIRNQHAGTHEVYADNYEAGLFDQRCYESFN